MYRELLNIHDSLARTWADLATDTLNDFLISAKEEGLSVMTPSKFANNTYLTVWETIALMMFQKMTGKTIFLAGRTSIPTEIWGDAAVIQRTFRTTEFSSASAYTLNENNDMVQCNTIYRSLAEPVPECEFQIIPLRSNAGAFTTKFSDGKYREVLKELDLKFSTDVNNIFINATQRSCAGILSDLKHNRLFYVIRNAHDNETSNTLLILIAYTAQAYKVFNNLPTTPESECFKKILYRIRNVYDIPHVDIVNLVKDYLRDTQFLKRDLNVLYRRLIENMNKRRVGSLQREYQNAVENKNKFFQRYNDALLRQEEISKQLSIIRTHDYNDGLIEFMQRCPIIFNITPGRNTLKYDVMQPFGVNDEDEFKRVYKNNIEYMVEESLRPYIAKLIEEIFFDHTLILYCQSNFCLDIDGTKLFAQTFAKNEELNALPMPHLYYYGCLGSHMNIIQRFMNEGNYVNAVEQSLEATRELNWSDSTVVDKFLTSLTDYNNIKCLARPDDPTNHFSIREYIQEVEKAQ